MSSVQLSRLLDLPEADLQQVLDYATTLSKAEAADHFKNLLGDSPQAIEFISSFNSRRKDPAPISNAAPSASNNGSTNMSDHSSVPKSQRKPSKKKAPLHTPAPRQIADLSLNPGAGTSYSKKAIEDDYMPGRKQNAPSTSSSTQASAVPAPRSSTAQPKPQPHASHGTLVSDLLAVPKPKSKPASNSSSRSSTPGPTARNNGPSQPTKITLTGGTAMHGASTAISDLDAAIRSLEISTNPSLNPSAADDKSRACNCVATRHPLQSAAPNCTSCGKVICLKEGLGPCTYCHSPILSAEDLQAMIRQLKFERGKEKQAADAALHRKVDVAGTPKAYTKPRNANYTIATNFPGLPTPAPATAHAHAHASPASEAELAAKAHRDKLLAFQSQNARRTTVRDEAADFDIPTGGASQWSSPQERAQELKRQQKLLREMEWNARPEYEKRQQVLSIDLSGGKVMRKMIARERPVTPPREDLVSDGMGTVKAEGSERSERTGGGTFSNNPLLGSLIKPVYDTRGKGAEQQEQLPGRKDREKRWRRVQDDLDDNEAVLLDGGIYGGGSRETAALGAQDAAGGDEPGGG